MGKHEYMAMSYGGNCCLNCGIVCIPKSKASTLPCPPWSSTDEGDTKTNRGYEAGVVKELREVQLHLLEAADLIGTSEALIEKLIQKHEGHEQS